MDTLLIYNYLTDLKTGYCESLEAYKRQIMESEIKFRGAYTQYLAQNEGKGYNLILNDFKELEDTLKAFTRGRGDIRLVEQVDYALEKTTEAIEYIKRARRMYESGEEIKPQRETSDEVSETKVISGTEGLANFLGCGKSMAFSVIKSGALLECGIQYKVGNCWKFNAERLREFLSMHPHFLSEIRCIR